MFFGTAKRPQFVPGSRHPAHRILESVGDGDNLRVLTSFHVVGGGTLAATTATDQGDLDFVVALRMYRSGKAQFKPPINAAPVADGCRALQEIATRFDFLVAHLNIHSQINRVADSYFLSLFSDPPIVPTLSTSCQTTTVRFPL